MLQSRFLFLLCAGILFAGTQQSFFITAKTTPIQKQSTAAESSRTATMTMAVGETSTIPGTLFTPVFVNYSSNSNVASLSPSGVITARNIGTSDIFYHTFDGFACIRLIVTTAKEANRSDRFFYRTEPTAPIELSSQVLFMEPGDSYQASLPDGAASGSALLRWESSDQSIARVSSNGTITAQGKGSATITCSGHGSSRSIHVNVVTRDYNGNVCDFSILTANGSVRTYRLYKQNAHNYPKYDSYLAWHGCATCSLTSVLGAYNPVYANILPSEVIDGPEKDTVSARAWNREHKERSLPRQMPLSLYGITSILNKHGVRADYIRTYSSDTEAAHDIISHLQTGNPVIFEVRQKSNITGKKSSRWTNSYHTMVLLGVLTNGKVLIYDPVDKNWDNNGNRITITDLSDVMEFMFPCTKIDQAMYYNGSASDGGYIKVFDAAE